MHTDFTASYTESSVVHQSQDPSAPFPLAVRTSEIVVLSKPCSSMRAAEVDSWRENMIARIAGGTTRTCCRTAFLSTFPCEKIAWIPPCIVPEMEQRNHSVFKNCHSLILWRIDFLSKLVTHYSSLTDYSNKIQEIQSKAHQINQVVWSCQLSIFRALASKLFGWIDKI